MSNSNFFKYIPKIELHMHIEGAIPIPALWGLVKKYDNKKTIKSKNDLEKSFVYKDFSHFLDIWVWKNTFIREYEDFSFLAAEVVKDLINQNYRYIEFFFTPSDHVEKGIEPQTCRKVSIPTRLAKDSTRHQFTVKTPVTRLSCNN